MIDAKKAVLIAKEKAAEMIGPTAASLEEIERNNYRSRDVWDITLGFPQTPSLFIARDPLKYKRFLIDAETGELIAVKLREVGVL